MGGGRGTGCGWVGSLAIQADRAHSEVAATKLSSAERNCQSRVTGVVNAMMAVPMGMPLLRSGRLETIPSVPTTVSFASEGVRLDASPIGNW